MTHELAPEEMEYLNHHIEAGLLRKVASSKVENALLQKGYAYRGVGGLVLTESAYKLIGGKR